MEFLASDSGANSAQDIAYVWHGKPVVRESKVQEAVRIAAQGQITKILVVKEFRQTVQQSPCGPAIALRPKHRVKTG